MIRSPNYCVSSNTPPLLPYPIVRPPSTPFSNGIRHNTFLNHRYRFCENQYILKPEEPKSHNFSKNALLTCTVKAYPKGKEYMFLTFLNSFEGFLSADIFLHASYLHPKFFIAMEGDIVDIQLRKKESKPFARIAFLKECSSRRTQIQYLEILTKLEKMAFEDNGNHNDSSVLRDALKYTCIWVNILNFEDIDINCVYRIMKMVVTISKQDFNAESLIKSNFRVILNTRAFRFSCGIFKKVFDPTNLEYETLIVDFLELIAKYAPYKHMLIMRIIDLIKPPAVTYHTILMAMSKPLRELSNMSINDFDWQELPSVVVQSELTGTIMESRKNLMEVPLGKGFKSVEMYYDTYVRLLREDCFYSLKKGISAYLSCNLDIRDMNVYRNVSFCGHSFNHDGFFILVAFNSLRKVKNWAASSALMYGNLLALSPKGDFTDCIWMTVAKRDLDLLNKGQVVLEFCDQDQSISDIFPLLLKLITANGKTVAVESPTYYKAYAPILKSLQSADIHSLPFQEELLSLKCINRAPSYINDESVINDKAVLLDSFIMESNVQKVCEFKESLLHSEKYVFDSYQRKALKQVLENRLAIIQGAPGCGKTFIGAKLVSLLLTIDTLPKRPIVVLTYKNHALDEFLKHLLNSGCQKLARIGSRCDDGDLEMITLGNIKHENPHIVYNNTDSIQTLLDHSSSQLSNTLDHLSSLSLIDEKVFVCNALSLPQLHTLINCAPCNEITVSNNALRKFVGRNGRLNLQAVKKIFKHLCEKMSIFDAIEYHKNFSDTKVRRDPNHFLIINAIEIFNVIFEKWLPTDQEIDNITDQLNSADVLKEITAEKVDHIPDTVEEEEDEEEVERKLRERLAAAGKSSDMSLKFNMHKTSKYVQRKPFLLNPFSQKLIMEYSNIDFENIKNLWILTKWERYAMIQKYISETLDGISTNFTKDYEKFADHLKGKCDIESHNISQLLESKSVIGVTITGASIYKNLLNLLKPAIVLVEEAAEVLEPQIMAVLNSHVEHLILIGDHKQLRPKVNDFKLAQNYHFEKSMMERLIFGKYPYACLMTQNRMAPQISTYLKDMYPNIIDSKKVLEIKCLPFFQHHVYFWNHSYEEVTGRSHTNPMEAQLIVELARFMINQEFKPTAITILSAYLGQTALLRKLVKSDPTSIFGDFSPKSKNKIQVQTIDMFQGDENEIIIVSLVRSNNLKKIGFLHNINRRVVAQSRAKRCVIFVGNASTLCSSTVWTSLIDEMNAKALVNDYIVFNCKIHQDIKIKIHNIFDFYPNFCKVKCDFIYQHCEHLCPRFCQPYHIHENCELKFQFVLNHRCDHLRERYCYESEDDIICTRTCNQIYFDCHHICKKDCEPKHTHAQFECSAKIRFNCKKCGGALYRECSKNESYENCTGSRDIKCRKCERYGPISCSSPDNQYKCHLPCQLKLSSCGHNCAKLCFQECSPNECVDCENLRLAEAEAAKNSEQKFIEDELKRQLLNIQRSSKKMYRVDLSQNKDAAEFLKVKDIVVRYVQPEHNWYPFVKKVQKIHNPFLRAEFIKSQLDLNSFNTDLKFHGTSKEAIDSIVKSGFRLPSNSGMYGKGIYLASDSSKSAQKIYTKGSDQLLLCEVCLGRSKTVNRACNDMTGEQLMHEGFDSLFAKRGTKATGGVLFDEFIVFNPFQVYPLYVIHYACKQKCKIPYHVKRAKEFTKRQLTFERKSPIGDKYQFLYQVAAAQFLLLKSRRGLTVELDKIFYYENPDLVDKFKKKKAEFKKLFGKSQYADEILAFHRTPHSGCVDGLMKNNFDNSAYGCGHYFSEFPDISIGNRETLILCRLLPGKSNSKCNADNCKCFSHTAKSDSEHRCKIIVIKNTDQILPTFSFKLR